MSYGMNGWNKENRGDSISRAAAIKAVKDRYYKYGRSAKVEELAWAIEALPSAQPEIIRCRDCCYWIPGLITDNDCFIPPKCGKWKCQQMVGHFADDYCSYAERREVSE